MMLILLLLSYSILALYSHLLSILILYNLLIHLFLLLLLHLLSILLVFHSNNNFFLMLPFEYYLYAHEFVRTMEVDATGKDVWTRKTLEAELRTIACST